METFLAWTRQPTTVAGLAALLGTASALLLQQITWPQAIPLLVGAAASMALPDNTGTKTVVAASSEKTIANPYYRPEATGAPGRRS